MTMFSVAVTASAADIVGAADLNFSTERLEAQKVGVESTSADDVTAGRWQHHLARASQDWTHEQDGGAQLGAELVIGLHRRDLPALNSDPVRTAELLDIGAKAPEDLEEHVHVADAWNVVEDDRLVRQKRCRDAGERLVLVASRPDGPRERVAPFDYESTHRLDSFGGRVGIRPSALRN
jgi:hypothetical protein